MQLEIKFEADGNLIDIDKPLYTDEEIEGKPAYKGKGLPNAG